MNYLDKGTYSVAEAARRLGISPTTAYALIDRGEFPVRVVQIAVVQIGSLRKVLVAELETFLAGGPAQIAAPQNQEPPVAAGGSHN